MVHRMIRELTINSLNSQLLLKLKLTVGILLFLLLSKSYAFVLSDQLPLIENTEWVDTQSENALITSAASSFSLHLPNLQTAPTVFYADLIGSNKALFLARSSLFSRSTGLSLPTPRNHQLLQWLHRRTVPHLGIYQ